MNRTSIEWSKNPDGTPGYTWNPITGCLNGCEYCYARKLANGRLRSRYLANPDLPLHSLPYSTWRADPFYPRFWSERFDVIGDTIAKPRGIFVCDMSDLFGIGIPDEWIKQVLEHIRWCSLDRFYLLTKQPQNLAKFSPFPDNCWVGVTATDHKMFVEACLLLGDIKAKVKYISLEPLLSWGDFPADGTAIEQWAKGLILYGIKWIITGAQTKPYKPPRIEWVKEITKACDKANIPVFHKNNLKPIFPKPTNTLRQEMPK